MSRRYAFPFGPLVDKDGNSTPAGRAYLIAIQDLTNAVGDMTNLDGGTSYTADELRDKIIELITVLQG